MFTVLKKGKRPSKYKRYGNTSDHDQYSAIKQEARLLLARYENRYIDSIESNFDPDLVT